MGNLSLFIHIHAGVALLLLYSTALDFIAAMSVPEVRIPGARGYPMVGLGTFTIFEKTGTNDEVEQAVKAAIDIGYRSIDCAYAYQNEASVGRAIKAKIDDGTIKREDLFVTTKLWDTCHRPAIVREKCEKSLKDLGCGYIDLWLIHWPFGFQEGDELFPKDENGKIIFSDVDYVDTYKAMEQLVDAGLVKALGLSNFNHKQVDRVMQIARVPVANLQIEVHPYLSNKKLVDYCKSKGISVTAYAPLGNPTRTWAGSDEPVVFDDPKLQAIAKAKGKTIAQVCLRFLIQRDIIVIPKSVTPSRIKENFQIFDFELSDEEMNTIWSLNRNVRFYVERIAADHKYFPFNEEF